MAFKLLVIAFTILCIVNGAPVIEDAVSSPLASQFDYIIVGGGATGCPLAVTLSQHFKVLVLERGGNHDPNTLTDKGFGLGLLNIDNYTSSVQSFASEEGVLNHRARVLGGGTSINAGFYSRASPLEVYQAGWDGQLANESYKWVEDQIAFFPKLGEWQKAFRRGLLESNVVPDNGATFEEVVGTKIGGTLFDNAGKRHSVVDILNTANADNLVVYVHATVDRILFQDADGSPAAYGVQYSDKKGGKHEAAITQKCKSDIILCAGALGSPQLLMLSGIGPSSHLHSFNISLVLDLPSVGRGMADNPTIRAMLPVKKEVAYSLVTVVGKTNSGAYIESSSAGDINFITALIRASTILPPRKRLIRAKLQSIASQVVNLHQQLLSFQNKVTMTIMKIIGPFSKGHLFLRSTDVRDNPSVKFNYFSNHEDMNLCVKGVRVLAKVLKSEAIKNFTYPDQNAIPKELRPAVKLMSKPIPKKLSYERAASFCRQTVSSLWHYHGGCQVGSVVNENYQVLGVKRLRVVDGSTFNSTPGANPQATAMMLGRYMGVRILQE